jgi:triacylglycerol lipase
VLHFEVVGRGIFDAVSLARLRARRQWRWASHELGGVLREAGASVLAYELYPLGVATPSTPVIPPLRVPKSRPNVPVLFIHGLLHNASTFAWIKQKMVLAGWRDFRAIELSTLTHSIPEMGAQTAALIQDMKKEFKTPHVDIIAHSMGGLVARYALQVLSQDGSIRKLVTLGTPHQGTELSRYSFLKNLKDLSPQSPLMQSLRTAPLPRKTQAISIHGTLDVLVKPRTAAHWDGVRNIRLAGVGHAGLLFSKRVIQILFATLHPDTLEPRLPFFIGSKP